MNLEKLRAHLESEEGKKSMEEYFGRIAREKEMKDSQLVRFHKSYSNIFGEIIEKIITKYESDEYILKEMKLGFEPRCPLYYFMFNYAEKYGRECNDKEYEKYGNDFTGGLYFINGYYIQIMHGQGSAIRIDKDERLSKLERITK